MSAVPSLLDRLAPDPSDGRTDRVRDWFDAHGLPSNREEAWRYTAVDDIAAALGRATPAPSGGRAVTRADVDDLAGDHGGPRVVFVNGALDAGLSDTGGLPRGVRFGSGAPRTSDDDPPDGFDALNQLAATDEASVLVDAGVRVDEPLHVVHLAVPGDGVSAVHPRTAVRAGPRSRVAVIETYVGLGGDVVTNASTRIEAGHAADVTHHRVQAEPRDALHVGRTRVEQAADSHVRATSVMVGASIARSAVEVRLAEPGARVDLRGLYLPTGHQRHDNVVTVDHAAPHGTSTQLYKGVIDDHGRGSFTGHVIVRPGADGTDASQSNRNLVLRPTAQVDTRPWLEILADDVRCAHGATVGRLDDDALFYLRSRGIPLAQSRALLVAAFVAELTDDITPPSLRELVAATFAGRLAGPTP